MCVQFTAVFCLASSFSTLVLVDPRLTLDPDTLFVQPSKIATVLLARCP